MKKVITFENAFSETEKVHSTKMVYSSFPDGSAKHVAGCIAPRYADNDVRRAAMTGETIKPAYFMVSMADGNQTEHTQFIRAKIHAKRYALNSLKTVAERMRDKEIEAQVQAHMKKVA